MCGRGRGVVYWRGYWLIRSSGGLVGLRSRALLLGGSLRLSLLLLFAEVLLSVGLLGVLL